MVLFPAFLLFAVIMPAMVVLAMRWHYKHKTLLPHQVNFDPEACYRYGFLFLGYEEETYGWEVLVMIRKAAFVLTSGLLRPYGPVAQVVGASIILIICLSLHLQIRPYDSQGHDKMESVSIHCSLLILMMVLLASIVGQDTTGKLGPISSVILIIVVFGCTGLFFSTAWHQIMRHSHTHGGIIGMIARRTSRKAKFDRRHEIHFDTDELDIPDHSSGASATSGMRHRGGGTSVVPLHKRKNKIGGIKKGLTMGNMRNALVLDSVNTLERDTEKHRISFHKDLTNRKKTAVSRTQLRLKKRLSKAKSMRIEQRGGLLLGAMNSASLLYDDNSVAPAVAEKVQIQQKQIKQEMKQKMKQETKPKIEQEIEIEIEESEHDAAIKSIKATLLSLVPNSRRLSKIFKKLDTENKKSLNIKEFHALVNAACQKAGMTLEKKIFSMLWESINHVKVENHDELTESALGKWLFQTNHVDLFDFG